MRRLAMKKIKEALRLRATLGLSAEKIAHAIGIGETTIRRYFLLAHKAGISWPLPEGMDEGQLEELLYPPVKRIKGNDLPLIDFEYVCKELKRKGVTLGKLWEELADGQKFYSYSQFCLLYKRWKDSGDVSMRQIHKGGEKTFIDYAGLTIPIYEPIHGEVSFKAQIFVAVLGASGYVFCEATASQKIEDWVASHKRMGEFFEGTTEAWIPDNLKAGVTKADRYEPDINSTYQELALHYGAHIIPARVRKPQDKSKAEGGVYFVETYILASLRDRKFFNLDELNEAIKPLVYRLNREPFQKMPGSSRYSFYLEIEQSTLKPLPDNSYELFLWGRTKVDSRYHIVIEDIPYSVPHNLVQKTVEFRYNARTVEVFYRSKCVAIHMKGSERYVPVTAMAHCPPKHQHQAKCTKEGVLELAKEIGSPTLMWVERVLEDSSLHLTQRINTALGVVRLTKTYSNERLNSACGRGLFYENFKARGIKDILKRGLDKDPLPIQKLSVPLPQNHSNIRGAAYYS